jgi:hypothetical protein
MITAEAVERFHADGFLLLPGFYDVPTEIEPIQRGIHDIIGLVAAQRGIDLRRAPFSTQTFDDGYLQLVETDRALGGVVYDAVKQLAPFVRLVGSHRNEALFRTLRSTGTVGVAGGGSGIRIDNPAEDAYRTPWHQEYPAQFRSIEGVVYWSPLRALTSDLGPVEVCVGSHRAGLVRVTSERGTARSGAYALRLEDEDAVTARYPTVAPICGPGDLLLMDFLTIHRSGHNRDTRSRWTMQLRYFGFDEPAGMRIDWAGSFAAGRSINDVHPDLEIVPT